MTEIYLTQTSHNKEVEKKNPTNLLLIYKYSVFFVILKNKAKNKRKKNESIFIGLLVNGPFVAYMYSCIYPLRSA